MDSGYITKAKVLCVGVAHHVDDLAEALLGHVVGRGGVHRGKDLDVDLLAPVHRQLQQAQRVAGGRRVEDDDVPLVLGGEVDELVEGGHLLGAGRVQLLCHDLDRLLGPAAPAGVVQDAGLVGSRPRPSGRSWPPTGWARQPPARPSSPTGTPSTSPRCAAGSVVSSSVL